MPFSFSARITRKYDDVFEWIDGIKCKQIAVYEHEADEEVSRTHIHFLVIDSEVNVDALKTRYKKLYGGIEAKDWRFKYDVNDNSGKFITYMSKGKLAPKLTKGYEVSEIEKCTSEWVEPNKTNLKVIDGKLVRDIDEPGQKTKTQLLEQMRSRLCPTDTTREILKHIRHVLVANRVIIGQYKMMDYYDSIMMYERKSDWLDGMERKINSRQGI